MSNMSRLNIPTPDATTTATGKIELAGSLGGTATSPTVVTNANLTGDVTSVGNATTLAAGSASNLNSGTLPAGRMPALTGDVTTSAGAVATAIGAGKITQAMLDTSAGGIGAAWQSFTPSLTNWTIGTGGSAGTTAKFLQIGKLVVGRIKSTLGSSGQSVSGEPTFNLPVTANSDYANLYQIGTVWMKAGGTGFTGYFRMTSTTACKLVVMSANATYVSDGTISSTVPATWAAGDLFNGMFVYEAA